MCVKFAADLYSNNESAANFTHIGTRLINMLREYAYLDQFRKLLWSGPYAYTHNHDIILTDKYRNTNFIETKKEPYYVSSHFFFFQRLRQSSAPSFGKVAHREPMAQVFYE